MKRPAKLVVLAALVACKVADPFLPSPENMSGSYTARQFVAADTQAVAAPRVAGLARVRRALGHLPFFRAFVAMEATLLALAAAIGDEIVGDLDVTRGLLIALVPIAAFTAAGHLLAILTSSRLR